MKVGMQKAAGQEGRDSSLPARLPRISAFLTSAFLPCHHQRDCQNLYLKLSCQIRMNPAWISTRPKLVELIALLVGRLPNFAVFVRLRISKRISPLCPPANRVTFASTRSTFLRNWKRASGFVRGAFP